MRFTNQDVATPCHLLASSLRTVIVVLMSRIDVKSVADYHSSAPLCVMPIDCVPQAADMYSAAVSSIGETVMACPYP